MATNKHAIIRYRALDKCFGNFNRRFFIEDLIEACAKAIYEYTGINNGVSRRQVFDDINYMESEEGWSIPLLRLKDGKRTFYRYGGKDFSINRQPLSPTELEQLKDTIYILNRFSGMPQFDWMNEVLTRFESSFNLRENITNAVSFQENPDLKGLHYFTDIFNAIVNKQVLRITYKYFSKPAVGLTFHPYHLKQYNNRWFIFGYDSACGKEYPLTSLALDRIEDIKPAREEYIENKDTDFFDYFYDVVGVTVPHGAAKEKILLKAGPSVFNYIATKPLHASQKTKERTDEYVLFELNLIINYEFETLLLGYANDLEIIVPTSLRERISERAKRIAERNQ